MSMNVVASTSSALAAGLLRFQLAGNRVTEAAAASVDPDFAPDAAGDAGASPLAVYDARGRTAAPPASDDLVSAVGDMLSAEQGVKVDAAVLKRVYDVQGTLLDVFA
jgi:hypothetical protein